MATRKLTSCNESTDNPLLHGGDQMTQEEFHRLYSAMPDGYRAELVGGTVFEPSPLGVDHSDAQAHLIAVFLAYAGGTPGLQAGDNATTILGREDEVQPDLFLRIRPQYGGQSRDIVSKGKFLKQKGVRFIEGAPELLAEVCHTSRAIDLHLKKKRYIIAGVLEYLVVCLNPQKIYWFDLKNQTELTVGGDGILRSIVYPGLWLDTGALFRCDYATLMDRIAAGMRTAEYEEFRNGLVRSKDVSEPQSTPD